MSVNSFDFPGENKLESCLSSYLSEKNGHLKEDITKVSALATQRFADSTKTEPAVEIGSRIVVYDLRTGRDGFTGESIEKINLPNRNGQDLLLDLKQALFKCAKKSGSLEPIAKLFDA